VVERQSELFPKDDSEAQTAEALLALDDAVEAAEHLANVVGFKSKPGALLGIVRLLQRLCRGYELNGE
jgi:hypothetical protein